MNHLHHLRLNPNQSTEQLLKKFQKLESNPVIAAALEDIDLAADKEEAAARKHARLEYKIAESNYVMCRSRHSEHEHQVEAARNLLNSAMSDLEESRESVRDSVTRLNAASRSLHSLGESCVKTGIARITSLIIKQENEIAVDREAIARASYVDCQYRHEVDAKRERYRMHLAGLENDLADSIKTRSDLQGLLFSELSPRELKSRVRELLLLAGILDADEIVAAEANRVLFSVENQRTTI